MRGGGLRHASAPSRLFWRRLRVGLLGRITALLGDQGKQRVFRLRAAQQKSLRIFAAHGTHRFPLRLRFHPLGHDYELLAMGQRHDPLGQFLGRSLRVNLLNDALVQLDDRNRQAGEIGNRRIPAAEIVEGNTGTGIGQAA